jgi:hypothetical protein
MTVAAIEAGATPGRWQFGLVAGLAESAARSNEDCFALERFSAPPRPPACACEAYDCTHLTTSSALLLGGNTG